MNAHRRQDLYSQRQWVEESDLRYSNNWGQFSVKVCKRGLEQDQISVGGRVLPATEVTVMWGPTSEAWPGSQVGCRSGSQCREQRGLPRKANTASSSPVLSAVCFVTFYFDLISNLGKIKRRVQELAQTSFWFFNMDYSACSRTSFKCLIQGVLLFLSSFTTFLCI